MYVSKCCLKQTICNLLYSCMTNRKNMRHDWKALVSLPVNRMRSCEYMKMWELPFIWTWLFLWKDVGTIFLLLYICLFLLIIILLLLIFMMCILLMSLLIFIAQKKIFTCSLHLGIKQMHLAKVIYLVLSKCIANFCKI